MKIRRFFSLFLALCLLLTACGGSAPADRDVMNEAGYAESMDFSPDYDMIVAETSPAADLKTDGMVPEAPLQSDRKLIKTVEINAETEQYDDLLTALDQKLAALGGYTESRRTGKRGSTRRWCDMTLRIPADSLSDFVAHVDSQANVLSTAEDTRDVTLQYSDTEAKITALRTEQARLLELLSGANNLSEILEVEARLSDVTYELERWESQKRGFYNQVSYATVHLSITEVETLTPVEEPTVWEQIRTGFLQSLEGVTGGFVDLFILVTAGSPYIAVYGGLLAIAVYVLRKLRRNKQKTEQSTDSQTP